jgi:quinol monooxygenase YgiN
MTLPRRRFLQLAAGCVLLAPPAWVAPAGAQSPPGPVFAVMALDVAPGQAAQGVAVLKPYREATRKLAGNLAVDILQEMGRPNRFMIYENWQDHAAYDAAGKGAPLAELRDKLKPLAAPYDRRDYTAVSIGPEKAATVPGAVYMQVHLDVFPPGIAKTLVALKELAEAARKGEGNLRFDVVQSIQQPTSHTTLYGGWQSRKAYDAFEGSGYARRFRDAIGPLLGSPYDDRLYALVD